MSPTKHPTSFIDHFRSGANAGTPSRSQYFPTKPHHRRNHRKHAGPRRDLTTDQRMTQFDTWCDPVKVVPINGHVAGFLISNDDDAGIEAVASTLSEKYVKTEALAMIAANSNKPQFAEYLRKKFPNELTARSGDIGEILATSYLEEEGGYTVGPSRLMHRDHQEWAMRGDDVLGAKFDASSQVQLAKGEAKSRGKAYNNVVVEAREGLEREQGLPSGHSLAQFAERLVSTPDEALGVAIFRLLATGAVRPGIVRHLMFLFTTNNPIKHVSKDLNAYTGPIEQLTVTLQVGDHKRFINSTYEMAPNYGP